MMAETGGNDALVIFLTIDTDVESKKIGEGHAYDKHVLGTNNQNGKEFEKDKEINGLKFPNDSITTKAEFVEFIKDIMDNPDDSKTSDDGTKKYFWDDDTGTIVIYNPNDPDHGTCFRPTDGKNYYDDQH